MAQRIDATYPTITRWVMGYGWIEMGHDDMSRSFVRALDEGGLVWEGQEDYATLDDALQDLEAGLVAWMREQHRLVPYYTCHQPDIPLCVLPGPRPRPQADPTLYGRTRGESRCSPWFPKPRPTRTQTRPYITQHNAHDERNQFYFSTPPADTLYIRNIYED